MKALALLLCVAASFAADGIIPTPSHAITPTSITVVAPDPAPSPITTPGPVQTQGAPSFVIPQTCASSCRIRDASGKCLASTGETCGPGYACVPRCVSRDTAGNCMAYGADFCAAGAICVPTCLVRTSGQVCSAYTSDTCTQAIVGTR